MLVFRAMKSKLGAALVFAILPAIVLVAQRPPVRINNLRIIDLVGMGVSEQEIIRMISAAEKIDFDLRPVSTDAMLNAGVSEEIIQAMAGREASVPISFDSKGRVVMSESQHRAPTAASTAALNPTLMQTAEPPPGLSQPAATAPQKPSLVPANLLPVTRTAPAVLPANSSARTSTPSLPVANASIATQHLGKAGQYAVVRALGNRVIPYHTSFNLNIPGNVRTSCYGSGSWNYSSVSCSSWVNPPTQIPIDIVRVDVYQQVALNGQTYTLKCTSHWLGSSCNSLRPDDTFNAQIRGGTMQIEAHKGGNMGKVTRPRFHILDIR